MFDETAASPTHDFTTAGLHAVTLRVSNPCGVASVTRQVRVGGAYMPGPDVIIAIDADLTTTETPLGDRRNLAAGAERWWGTTRRMAVRGGGRVSTTGDARASARCASVITAA